MLQTNAVGVLTAWCIIPFTQHPKPTNEPTKQLTYVESSGSVGLGEHHVRVPLELAVETLEQVFEE